MNPSLESQSIYDQSWMTTATLNSNQLVKYIKLISKLVKLSSSNFVHSMDTDKHPPWWRYKSKILLHRYPTCYYPIGLDVTTKGKWNFQPLSFQTSAALKFHHFWCPPRSEKRSRSPEGAPHKTLHFGVQPWLKLSSKSPGCVLWRGNFIGSCWCRISLSRPSSQGRIVLPKNIIYSTSRCPQHTYQYGVYYPCLLLSYSWYRVVVAFIDS